MSGNEIFKESQLLIGNLYFEIDQVIVDDESIKVSADNQVELEVKILPSQALNGFSIDREYLNGEVLHFKREHVVTKPNHLLKLKGILIFNNYIFTISSNKNQTRFRITIPGCRYR